MSKPFEGTPRRYRFYPWNSVTEKAECERVAQNIMIFLALTGNEFRPLSWEEYKEQRLIDGGFSEAEKPFFEQVIGYCQSPETAALFSPEWA